MQFFLLGVAAFLFSGSYIILPMALAVYLFFCLFLLLGAYTIYLFLDLEQRLPAAVRSRYYQLTERLIHVTVILYFLLFLLTLEKIWAIHIAGRGVNTVFMAMQSFLAAVILLLGIRHVSAQVETAVEYQYTAEHG